MVLVYEWRTRCCMSYTFKLKKEGKTRQLHLYLKFLHSWTTIHSLPWVKIHHHTNLCVCVSNFNVSIHLWDKICDVTWLMGLPPGTATQWSPWSELPIRISPLILDVWTEVHCLQLWTPGMIKALDFFTQPEPMWASNSELSVWLRTRHERCS